MTAFMRQLAGKVPVSYLAVLPLLFLAAVPAQANGRGTTTSTTIPFHDVFVNRCNGNSANLSGNLTITITTRPAAHGYTVNSRSALPDLEGYTVLPPGIYYTGQDLEENHQYVADPPYPSTVYDYHYTKLVPHSSAPTMYLVIVMKNIIFSDGTVPIITIVRIYLTCTPPSRAEDA